MGIVVEYQKDIAGFDDNPARHTGERYGVKDEAAAAKYHPFATIVSNEDGTPYDPDQEAAAATEPTEVKIPDWYKARQEKAETEARVIPEYVAGEKAAEFDKRWKQFEEDEAARVAAESAAAANLNATGNPDGENPDGSGENNSNDGVSSNGGTD